MHAVLIHIDYLPSKQTINGVALLDRFNNIFKEKTFSFGEEESSSSKIILGFTRIWYRWPNSMNSELLPHPAYSPAPCDYFLFPNLKKEERAIREQLIAETEAYFEGLNKSYYSDSLKKLENRCQAVSS